MTFASLYVDHGRRKLKRLRDRIGDGGDSNFQVEKEVTREENLFASLAKESQNYVSIPYTFNAWWNTWPSCMATNTEPLYYVPSGLESFFFLITCF